MSKIYVAIFSLCGLILYFTFSYATDDQIVPESHHSNDLCDQTKEIPGFAQDKISENKAIESFYDYLALNEYLANQYLDRFRETPNRTMDEMDETDIDSLVRASLFMSNDNGEIFCNQNNSPSEIKVCEIIVHYSKSHNITEALSVLKREVYPEKQTDKCDDSVQSAQNNLPDMGDEESQNMNPLIFQQDEAIVEPAQSEIPPKPLNTYDNIVKCVEEFESSDDEAKQNFKDNLNKLEQELSSVVEHAKSIGLSLIIFNGMVPTECLSEKLSQ